MLAKAFCWRRAQKYCLFIDFHFM